MQSILIAQNPEEHDMLAFVLKRAGLTVNVGPNLQSVAAKWLEKSSDLVIIAWDNGIDLVETIAPFRDVTQVPLLLLVDPLPESHLCQLLRAGADLVLTRPTSSLVLSEYIQVFLRRNQTVPTFVLPRLAVTSIRLDPDTRTVVVLDQEPRRLTQLEFRLLYVLMVNRGQVIPVDVIVERVWGYSGHGSRDLVRGLVSRLRRKIEPKKASPRFIQNVPGIGYRFSLDEV